MLRGESSDVCYPTFPVNEPIVEVSGPSRFGSTAFHVENLLVIAHTDLDRNGEVDPEDSLHVFQGDAAEVPPGFEYWVILQHNLDADESPGGGMSRLGSTPAAGNDTRCAPAPRRHRQRTRFTSVPMM